MLPKTSIPSFNPSPITDQVHVAKARRFPGNSYKSLNDFFPKIKKTVEIPVFQSEFHDPNPKQ